jgi:hypothetical protein
MWHLSVPPLSKDILLDLYNERYSFENTDLARLRVYLNATIPKLALTLQGYWA